MLDQIAYFQNRRDEIPNQELAKKLAETRDSKGIQEIAAHLWDKNAAVQSDCLKVLYEISFIDPKLVSEYVSDFLKLTQNKNNRLVWGAMIALSKTAVLNPEPCIKEQETLKKIILAGSVITQDNGIKTLAALAAANPEHQAALFPFLLDHLRTCRGKDVAQRSESIFVAVNSLNQAKFLEVLTQRLPALTDSQAKRVEKLIRNLKKK